MHFCDGHRGLAAAPLVVCLLATSALWAVPVGPTDARRVAEAFLAARAARVSAGGGHIGIASAARVRDVATLRELRDRDGRVLAYVAELAPRGFVITSADRGIAPIVAYSFRHAFPSDQSDHPLCRMLKEDLRRREKALAEYPQLAGRENGPLWAAVGAGDDGSSEDAAFQQWPPEGTTSTGGWLETVWDQHPPYNQLCPLDPVDGSRTYVGCVGTAYAQILNYHRQCNASFGADDEYKSEYGIDFDADSDRYDFPSFAELNDLLVQIRSKYDAGTDLDEFDMAALSFACGVAVEMDYSSEGSGAYSGNVPDALVDKFGFFSAEMTGGMSCDMFPVLQENLINGLPAYLTIITPDGESGHAIVCDGYNTDGEYHLNFGWGADRPETMTQVWYRLPVNVPSDLNVLTEAILNIRPDQPSIEVEPGSLLLYSLPGQESDARTLRIRSNEPNTLVHSITAPDGFLVARGDEPYSSRIDSFEIARLGEEVEIKVKFYSETGGSGQGVLEIAYGNGGIRNVIVNGCAFAGGTEIAGGEVFGRWSKAGSPYFVSGDLRVPAGEGLMIEPGVQVMFVGPYGVTVDEGARLLAMGNEVDPIEFTAWNRSMGWTGIRFWDSGDDDILRHCAITFVKKGAGILPPKPDEDPEEAAAAEPRDPNHCGAVYCYRSDPTIVNCRIANNAADIAGALYCFESRPKLSNTLIANNLASGARWQCGGIFADEFCVAEVDNCTIVNNSPGGIFSLSWDGMDVTNSVVWGNNTYQIEAYQSIPRVTFCDVQGGYPGQGNIDADPLFLAPSGGVGIEYDGSAAIWTITSHSPCINAGTEIDLPATDLAGAPRIGSDVVDLGAYENHSELSLITIVPSATLDAGFVHVNTTSAMTLVVRNTGQGSVLIENVSILGADDAFDLLTSVRGQTLANGDSLQVEVGFSPTEERKYLGTLRISSTAHNAGNRMVVLHGTGVSGTVVPGGAVNGTWTKAESPFAVTGDIFVPSGERLSIEPGAEIKFAGHYGLTVGFQATLSAVGTEEQRIVFTAIDPDEGWAGIRFVNTANEDELRHCTIEHARKSSPEGGGVLDLLGGGVLCTASDEAAPGFFLPSSPTIEHCVIAHNEAVSGGGIAVMYNSETVIRNCRIVDNAAEIYAGGLFIWGAFPSVWNNVIAHNTGYFSGGLTNWYALTNIINNTIVHNRPNGLHLETTEMAYWGPAYVSNNIIWDNEVCVEESVGFFDYDIRYNDIQGSWPGPGNIEADPQFADPENRDYHLRSAAGRWVPADGDWIADAVTSPCIDAGDPIAPVGNEPEPNGGRANMGAYGGTREASKSP